MTWLLSKIGEEIQGKLSKEEYRFVCDILNMEAGNGLEVKDAIAQELTQREREVLVEMERGCTNKEIADHLCISLATVKSHIINIYGKLGVNNRVAAVNKIKKG